MFENPRRGRQARNFTENDRKILDLKSSSEQIIFRTLSLGAPETINLNQMMGRKFPYVIYFSVFQLNKFRKLKGEHGRKPPLMCDNYRPIQPLNGRTVYSNRNND